MSEADQKAYQHIEHGGSDEARKPCPTESQNLLRQSTFEWVTELLTVGRKRPLTDKDLFDLPRHMEASRSYQLLNGQWLAMAGKSHRLARSLISANLTPYLIQMVALKLTVTLMNFSKPALLYLLLNKLADTHSFSWETYVIALSLAASATL